MLANIVDVDEAMIDASLREDNPAAILFDFAAAFPSIDHDYIFDVLTSRGWSEWFIKVLKLLYWNNVCCISLGGVRNPGFEISAGVRQGCPLSPLLFAIISDVLLRRLSRTIPRALVRAYADDLAMVLRSSREHLSTLESTFFEYGIISGMKLH